MKEKLKSGAFWVGLVIVLGTHLYMLLAGGLPANQVMPHAVLNLVAGALVVYAKFG